MALRYLEKFTNRVGTDEVLFPVRAYRATTSQQLRAGLLQAAGMNYPQRAIGFAPGLKAEARESLSFIVVDRATRDPLVVDAEVDELRSKLYRFGVGKLWTVDADSDRRWAWAVLDAMPEREHGDENLYHIELWLGFIRLSDWYAENPVTETVTLDASPKTFTVNNPGNANAGMLVIRLRANASGGFGGTWRIGNNSTGHSVESSRAAASADSEVRITAEAMAVEYTNDDGASYVNDYANVTLPDTQPDLLRIEPGDNNLSYEQGSGTPDATLEIAFYPAWH